MKTTAQLDPSTPALKPVKVMILAASLNPESQSQRVAREAEKRLQTAGIDVTLVDLRETVLPLAGTDASWSDPAVEALAAKAREASHFLFAVPIYNYDVNAAAKNAVELLGSEAFEGKTVGFLATAGGRSSFASLMPFANSLMLDFRSWIVPRFLYITEDVSAGLPPAVSERLDRLLQELVSHRT